MKIDQRLRAEFREAARAIIAHDRCARKFRRSQNTIGEIERAMVQAYFLGRQQRAIPSIMHPSEDGEEFVEWILIPARAREVISIMTLRFSKIFGNPLGEPPKITRFAEGARMRWQISQDGQLAEAGRSIADGSVRPLIKFGLIAPVDAERCIFALTAKGIATGREYWRRADANDPTLPIIQVR